MSSVKTLLDTFNFRPNKSLGQNFLNDLSLAEMIVKFSEVSKSDDVLEIGAGPGVLTILYARKAKMVYAIEKDLRLAEILKSRILQNQLSNICVIEKDILRVNIDELVKCSEDKIIVAGNLPYNISSQILIKLAMSRKLIRRAVVMLQKELAQRILEKPGSREYGRISVIMQYCSDLKKIIEVKAENFYPKPKVDSMVLLINFKERPDFPANNEEFLLKVIKAAFGQRRKILKNALKGSELHLDSDMAVNLLKKAGINPDKRAESLHIDEFVRLSNVIENYLSRY